MLSSDCTKTESVFVLLYEKSVSICTFVGDYDFAAADRHVVKRLHMQRVSINTFVLEKRQYLYICTRKADELRIHLHAARGLKLLV
jgi:hypothetical protein